MILDNDLTAPAANLTLASIPIIPVQSILIKVNGRVMFEHDAIAFGLICPDCGNRPHPINTHCGKRYDFVNGPKCGHPCNCVFKPGIIYHQGGASRFFEAN